MTPEASSGLMRRIQRRIERKRRPRHRLREVLRFHKDNDGQAMAEFCVILPVLLFLILGIIQMMLIANASYLLNLANFYALRTGVSNYENYQYRLASGNLKKKMEDAAEHELEPILPSLFSFRGFLTRDSIRVNTDPNVTSISASNRSNFLKCQTHMSYHLYVPFAGGIIASIYHWGDLNRLDWVQGEGIYVREHPFGLFHPLWPYIDMQTKNYDWSKGRSPNVNTRFVEHHEMAIARRIYR